MGKWFNYFTVGLWLVALTCPVPHWFSLVAFALPIVMCMLVKWNSYFHGGY